MGHYIVFKKYLDCFLCFAIKNKDVMSIFVQNLCAYILFPNVKFLDWSYMLNGIYSYILDRYCQIASLKDYINFH